MYTLFRPAVISAASTHSNSSGSKAQIASPSKEVVKHINYYLCYDPCSCKARIAYAITLNEPKSSNQARTLAPDRKRKHIIHREVYSWT